VSRFGSDAHEVTHAETALSAVRDAPAGAIDGHRSAELSAFTRTVLRTLDILIAASVLILTAPVVVFAAVFVRLDSRGPAIFRQRRIGLHKQPFTVYKFRTMRAQADPAVHRAYVQQLISGEERSQSSGRRDLYKLVADDRITRVGRFLRRTSLDELPQLWNVLCGQMSIVGPRPVLLYESELYPAGYDRRFRVKPGLTGLWQVSGRSRRTYREMIAFDIAWVERHSIALYLSIVLRTPWVLLRGRNAA
jgi:lipopolysaccharide/colanic/teichoic acid biosynthesis glycosyltransferase